MPHAALELDVRGLPPPKRHPEIFRTFDALAPGQAFVLVNDHDPKGVLYQLQAERPGRFEWSVLEAGGERFRIRIQRRQSGSPRRCGRRTPPAPTGPSRASSRCSPATT